MMSAPTPLTRELVLIGGGHAHALVLRRWGMKPLPGARLTLINPGPTAPYTGMLPGFVAGHYDRDALEIDLVRLARFAGARLILGEAEGIDRDNRRIKISGRADIAYDIASIDVGITSDMPALPGFLDHGIPAKPLQSFARRWAAYRDGTGPAAIAVIGAGVGGVELSMAMHHALAAKGRPVQITVVDRSEALPGLGHPARMALIEALRKRDIRLIENAEVTRVAADEIILRDGRRFPATLTVGTAGARPYRWLITTGLELTDGFLDVDDQLRTSDPSIYAAGDCAHLTHAPRPKAGVFAVRAAPVLAHNLRADLTGSARRKFQPQTDYLKLISLGEKAAVGEKWGQVLQGGWVWQAKDRIDRRFMDKLSDLPKEPAPALPKEVASGVRQALDGGKPLCGGCGSKVGPGTLEAALAALPAPAREDVERLPGDDAATLRFGRTRQVISTDHLRAFTEDPYALARIAVLHAMGDVWAMGAAPQAALLSVILPRLSEDLQAGWLEEILAGATRSLDDTGAALGGGHTTLGAELTLGVTVTGTTTTSPIGLDGAQPGDALILTRPIGSGTILAGEMAGEARGGDVAALMAVLQTAQGDAAARLTGAHAMTDVTGFGLGGHLQAICEASGTGAEIALADVPVFTGAEALAAAGARSTIFEANRAHAVMVEADDSPRARLLFDPQTAGGLLAAVPPKGAGTTVAKIRALGHDAALIGTVTDQVGRISVR